MAVTTQLARESVPSQLFRDSQSESFLLAFDSRRFLLIRCGRAGWRLSRKRKAVKIKNIDDRNEMAKEVHKEKRERKKKVSKPKR